MGRIGKGTTFRLSMYNSTIHSLNKETGIWYFTLGVWFDKGFALINKDCW